jgi:hypothetical protein
MTTLELNVKAKRTSLRENEVRTSLFHKTLYYTFLDAEQAALKADIKAQAQEEKKATPAYWYNWYIYDDYKP